MYIWVHVGTFIGGKALHIFSLPLLQSTIYWEPSLQLLQSSDSFVELKCNLLSIPISAKIVIIVYYSWFTSYNLVCIYGLALGQVQLSHKIFDSIFVEKREKISGFAFRPAPSGFGFPVLHDYELLGNRNACKILYNFPNYGLIISILY